MPGVELAVKPRVLLGNLGGRKSLGCALSQNILGQALFRLQQGVAGFSVAPRVQRLFLQAGTFLCRGSHAAPRQKQPQQTHQQKAYAPLPRFFHAKRPFLLQAPKRGPLPIPPLSPKGRAMSRVLPQIRRFFFPLYRVQGSGRTAPLFKGEGGPFSQLSCLRKAGKIPPFFSCFNAPIPEIPSKGCILENFVVECNRFVTFAHRERNGVCSRFRHLLANGGTLS